MTKGTAAPKVEHQHEIEYLTWLASGIEELWTSIVDVVGAGEISLALIHLDLAFPPASAATLAR